LAPGYRFRWKGVGYRNLHGCRHSLRRIEHRVGIGDSRCRPVSERHSPVRIRPFFDRRRNAHSGACRLPRHEYKRNQRSNEYKAADDSHDCESPRRVA
jgi:hypothetical protein